MKNKGTPTNKEGFLKQACDAYSDYICFFNPNISKEKLEEKLRRFSIAIRHNLKRDYQPVHLVKEIIDMNLDKIFSELKKQPNETHIEDIVNSILSKTCEKSIWPITLAWLKSKDSLGFFLQWAPTIMSACTLYMCSHKVIASLILLLII